MTEPATRSRGDVQQDGDLRILSVTKSFGDFTAVDDLDADDPAGLVLRPARPVGLRQDDHPADGRRPGGPDGRPDPHRRRGHHRREAVQAAGQHGLPELRAVPAPGHLRERGVRPAAPARRPTSSSRSTTRSSWSSSVTWPGASRPSCPAASSSGWRWPGRSSTAPRCCCSTSRSGALDLKLRRQMQIELKRIQTEVGITFVHVTHDQEEAMTMADTIAVMNAGRVEQMGDPAEPVREPVDDLRRELPRAVEPHPRGR